MKIFCCQLDIAWEDKPANYTKARALLTSTAPPPGSLVLLPEMFATGFSMNVAKIREGNPPQTEEFLARTARELGVFLVGGVINTGANGQGRNEAVAFSPDGKEIARYCKMQPFTAGGEAKHYEAGQAIVTFPWQKFVVAPFICYDLRFPELFRAAARRGAHLLTVIASWPVARIQHWITLLQARAIENQAYVAGVNRCGHDPKFNYNGRTLIISPHGEILADAGEGEGVISADLDLAGLLAWREKFPALLDMRADFREW